MAAQFRSWGYDTRIETFHVLFPTPVTRVLEMVAPDALHGRASPSPPWRRTRPRGRPREQLPVYNAYSVDGDVTGELVYVNYGVPARLRGARAPRHRREGQDRHRALRRLLARASSRRSPRSTARSAASSTPTRATTATSRATPTRAGAWRSDQGAQRGSVADMPLYPGDPLTPGVGATPEARRLPLTEARTLTRIPVLPISWADALPLLRELGGPLAPEAWRGAPAAHLPPRARARARAPEAGLRLEAGARLRRDRARCAAAERPDQWIMRGNHHDAWVNGANDPVSGLVAMMAEARALGALRKRRLGAAAHDRLRRLGRRGAGPARLDRVGGGARGGAARQGRRLHQHRLQRPRLPLRGRVALAGEARQRGRARGGRPGQGRQRAGARARAASSSQGTPEERKEARERADLRLDALGSGSDYTPFLQHLGHRLAEPRLRRRRRLGHVPLHLRLVRLLHALRRSRLRLRRGPGAAATAALVLRLADADVLPFEFTAFAETRRALRGRGGEAGGRPARGDRGGQPAPARRARWQAAADPREPFVAPAAAARPVPLPQLRAAAERGRAPAAQRARARGRARRPRGVGRAARAGAPGGDRPPSSWPPSGP